MWKQKGDCDGIACHMVGNETSAIIKPNSFTIISPVTLPQPWRGVVSWSFLPQVVNLR